MTRTCLCFRCFSPPRRAEVTRGEMCRGRTAARLANRRHRAFISVGVSDTTAGERKKEKRGGKSCWPKVAVAEVAETLTGNQTEECVCVCLQAEEEACGYLFFSHCPLLTHVMEDFTRFYKRAGNIVGMQLTFHGRRLQPASPSAAARSTRTVAKRMQRSRP